MKQNLLLEKKKSWLNQTNAVNMFFNGDDINNLKLTMILTSLSTNFPSKSFELE